MTSPELEPAVAARLAALESAAQAAREAPVEQALADEAFRVRSRASELAAQLLSPERLVELVLSDANLTRRASAMDALVKAGRRSLPALLAAVRGRRSHGVLFCLQVLGQLREPEALEILLESAADDDALLSQTAVEALGQQGDRRAVPVLIEALGRDEWTAASAAVALARLGDRRAEEPLTRLKANAALREIAEQALRVIRATPGEAR